MSQRPHLIEPDPELYFGQPLSFNFPTDPGPWEYGGYRYVLYERLQKIGPFEVRLAVARTLDGVTFEVLDNSNAPVLDSAYEAVSWKRQGENIAYAAFTLGESVDQRLCFASFDFTTNTWGSAITGGPVATGTRTIYGIKLSTGDFVFAYTVNGSPKQLEMVAYSGGWGSPVVVDTSNVDIVAANLAGIGSNKVRLFYEKLSIGPSANLYSVEWDAGVISSPDALLAWSGDFFESSPGPVANNIGLARYDSVNDILFAPLLGFGQSPQLGLLIITAVSTAPSISIEAVNDPASDETWLLTGFYSSSSTYYVGVLNENYPDAPNEQWVQFERPTGGGAWVRSTKWDFTLDPPDPAPPLEIVEPFSPVRLTSGAFASVLSFFTGQCGEQYYLELSPVVISRQDCFQIIARIIQDPDDDGPALLRKSGSTVTPIFLDPEMSSEANTPIGFANGPFLGPYVLGSTMYALWQINNDMVVYKSNDAGLTWDRFAIIPLRTSFWYFWQYNSAIVNLTSHGLKNFDLPAEFAGPLYATGNPTGAGTPFMFGKRGDGSVVTLKNVGGAGKFQTWALGTGWSGMTNFGTSGKLDSLNGLWVDASDRLHFVYTELTGPPFVYSVYYNQIDASGALGTPVLLFNPAASEFQRITIYANDEDDEVRVTTTNGTADAVVRYTGTPLAAPAFSTTTLIPSDGDFDVHRITAYSINGADTVVWTSQGRTGNPLLINRVFVGQYYEGSWHADLYWDGSTLSASAEVLGVSLGQGCPCAANSGGRRKPYAFIGIGS